ncbi:MAG: ROK family glucokinase [Lachnospiraceae bacterium]|nr:ROK family glucokinase [Lachnospiraceae bacterium]
MGKYIFGVDIGGTTVKIGLFTSEGSLEEKWEITTRVDGGGKHILGDIARSIEAKIAEKSISKDDILGIGMGVPGPVKSDGTVLKCVNLGWGIFNVAEEMSERTGFKVCVGNDANMAALGEMWQGGGKGYKDLVMVTLGTGVGGGIIIDGKMLSGVNGAGGEIGHIQVNDKETEVCGCGRCGCLEQYTSATGIVRMANIKLNNTETPSSLRNVQYISSKAIFDAAKSGDELAAGLVEEHGRILGKALAQIACVVDPDIFVIGGGVSKAGDIIIEKTSKYFQENAFHACKKIKFALATLGNDAGIYGGAYAILNS